MSRRASLLRSINMTISDIHYKILRKLGEGNFSTVKLASHSLTGEKVAIKILEKTKVTKLEEKERINRELAIMRKLNHYNIVKLYQIVETKLTIYLIQENVPGKEFMEYLTKKGKLKEVEACKFFHQIISGLEYMHQCGVAHRDFKPENILITKDDTILKIIDFGLGNIYKNNQLLKTACGSPCYAPPEMIKEESYNGAKSDIWSSGIILYLMLCGKLPFYHEQNEVMYEQILSGKFEHPNFLSDNAKDLLDKIIEVDPKKRLNFEEIKAHPWFNIIDKNELMHKGIDTNEDIIPIDEEIVHDMEKLGFNKMELRFNLLKNFHNKITAVYDLFLKKKIEGGKKSIADMHSDLYDEYMNNKENKISFYGSLEKALKNRICDDKKTLNILPNYFEDKYDDNPDDVVRGDNGSVIERLIKSGRFVYDEENMCLNRVANPNKVNLKKGKNLNENDSKYKTISQVNNKPKGILKKSTIEVEEEDSIGENKKKSPKESPNTKIKTKKKVNRKISEDFVKINNKKGKEENNDLYKEIEARIDRDGKKGKEVRKGSTQNIKGNHKIENNRASSVIKRKKKEEEFKNQAMMEEAKNANFAKKALSKSTMLISKSVNKRIVNKSTMPDANHETKKTKIMNHNNSKDLKGEFTLKKSKSKYNSKEIKDEDEDEDVFLKSSKTRKTYNHLRSSMEHRYIENKDMTIKSHKKNLNNSIRKIDNLSEYFISSKESKNINNNSLVKSHKNPKVKKIIKTTGKKPGKFKKIDA
jgi:5'-AMP-activated protein kinase catalytic alpha subunit